MLSKIFWNIPFFVDSYQDLTSELDTRLSQNTKTQIATVNAEFIVETTKNSDFYHLLAQNSLNTIDSAGVQWALSLSLREQQSIYHIIRTLFAYLFGFRRRAIRMPGVDLMQDLCAYAQANSYRVALIGGAPGAAKLTKDKLLQAYPELQIVYADLGFFTENEKQECFTSLKQAKPDFVFVALGAPKQEFFIQNELFAYVPSVKLAMGVWGTFDFLSGQVARAPRWMRKIWLEWLFRLITQPWRYKRILTAYFVFPYMVWKYARK